MIVHNISSFNLDREIGEDRRSLEAKEAVQREYLEKCSEKVCFYTFTGCN